MPRFPWSTSSLGRLQTCDPLLQDIFNKAADYVDITIICGARSEADQTAAFVEGLSKTPWPKSKHNKRPSWAVDAAPCPIDWYDRERAIMFAGFILAIAAVKRIKLRWGGDWNSNWYTSDEDFSDLWHFELVDRTD